MNIETVFAREKNHVAYLNSVKRLCLDSEDLSGETVLVVFAGLDVSLHGPRGS